MLQVFVFWARALFSFNQLHGAERSFAHVLNRAIRLLKLKDPQNHNIIPLELRRKTASMLLFRKHLLQSPDSLDLLISRSIPRAHHYAIRNNNHNYTVEPIRFRTAQQFNSFIPRVHQLWNSHNLPRHV